ncbi:MAG: AtpZ/AtpI family protein [Sporomusaceae bacterium]|nr:AtpZ/AtpI family protein [Sporomusaceae bacterium]
MPDRNRSYWSLLAAAGGIGLNFGVALVLGLCLGRAVDAWLELQPWGTIIGSLLGILTGMWTVIKLIMKG